MSPGQIRVGKKSESLLKLDWTSWLCTRGHAGNYTWSSENIESTFECMHMPERDRTKGDEKKEESRNVSDDGEGREAVGAMQLRAWHFHGQWPGSLRNAYRRG